MAGAFDIEGMLSQAAQGKFQPPPMAAPPQQDDSGIPTVTVTAPARSTSPGLPDWAAGGNPSSSDQSQPAPFDVESVLKQAARGQLKYTPQAPPSGGSLPQVGYGAQEGVMGLANIPTQIPRAIGELGTMAYNAITGRNAQNPTPTYQAGPFPEPQGTRESMARAIGQGLPAIPLMGAGEAAAAPSLARAGAAALRSAVTTTLPVVAGQVGGEAAREVAPEPYKEPAQIGGAVLGGGAVALGQGLAGAALRAGIARPAGGAGIGRQQTFQGVGGEPVRATATQADIAASKLREAADQSGPNGAERFQTMLEASPGEIVPGSAPTTAQVAPLPGIAKLEDTVKSSPGGGPAFNARAEQQNAARTQAISEVPLQTPWGLRPADLTNPAAVGQFFKDQLTAIDQLGQKATQAGRNKVQASTEALGGRGAPAAYGQEMRGAIQGALDPVQAERQGLWNAVDPDGTLAVGTAPIKQALQQIRGEITPSDTLTSGENAALQHADVLPEVAPFRELQSLRKNIGSASRQTMGGEPLTTQGERRLNILKSAVDESFAAAVEQKATQEAQAVASGVMTPEQTMMARLQEMVAKGRAGEQSTASVGTGFAGGEGAGGGAGGGATAAVGPNGAASQAGGRFSSSPRASGLQGQAQPLTPNFDEAAAARYAAAREATLREKERFGRGAVGEVLARGKAGAPNNVLDADVPAKFFTGRPSEPAQVKAYFKAVGGEPKGVALARDYLVSDLRRNSIIAPDGTLDAEAFARWQQRRGETIKLFPGLSDEFATAESAQRALDNVQEAHAAALKEFQNGVAKHFLNEEPGRAVQKMLNSADRARLMQQAIGKLQGNVDALESLKGHVIDYVLDRLTTSAKATEQNAAAPNLSEIGSLRADAFKDWITDNKPWLRRLFGGQGMQNLEMVGADLRRQQTRGIASSGSATTERAAAVQKHGGFKDHLPTILGIIGMKMGSMAAEAVGLHGVGELMSEAIGASVPVAAHAFRQRGITTVNDLVREAMLHPSVARELMARPKAQTIGNIAQRRLAHAMQAVAVAQSGTQETRE